MCRRVSCVKRQHFFDMENLRKFNRAFKQQTGAEFQSWELLEKALTHDSVGPEGFEFERMEFLGDACLEMVIATYLVTQTGFSEGQMSQFRSKLTRKESLASILRKWKIEEFFTIGRGMKIDNLSDSVYADFLESLFGALYLEQGFEAVKSCILSVFTQIIESQKDNPSIFSNAKSKLQELAMAQKAKLPIYTIVSRSGQDHNPTYVIEVRVLGQTFSAKGSSIKIAEHKAAAKALEKL